MPDTRIVKVDQGAVNSRIIAKEVKADFRRVEGASVKMKTRLMSPEAKRLFVRFFQSLQLNTHFISVIGRVKLKHEDIEHVEAVLREQFDAVCDELNAAIDAAEALFKANGITSMASYDIEALEVDVSVISSSGRRYFEILHKLDQFMPLLETLQIHEVITAREADTRRVRLKGIVREVAIAARRLARGLRRRMNDLDVNNAERARVKDVKSEGKPVAVAREATPAADETGNSVQLILVQQAHAAAAMEAKGQKA